MSNFPPVQLQDGSAPEWTCPLCGGDVLFCPCPRITASDDNLLLITSDEQASYVAGPPMVCPPECPCLCHIALAAIPKQSINRLILLRTVKQMRKVETLEEAVEIAVEMLRATTTRNP